MTKDSFPINHYENESWSKGEIIYGIDEVGRGCLAGPIVSACVILNKNVKFHLLKDSKSLKKDELKSAANWLEKNSKYTFSTLSNRLIDQHNIYQTTVMSMKKNIIHMMKIHNKLPKVILIDAVETKMEILKKAKIKEISLIKGESKSISIAAASIIAKVKRDEIISNLHNCFPAYKLEKHKGYGTNIHQESLYKNGKSLIHRKNFLGFLLKDQNKTIF